MTERGGKTESRGRRRGLAEATAPFASPPSVGTSVPLVAIGASAGGLEALEQFFATVEAPSRFAFVLVQHLSP